VCDFVLGKGKCKDRSIVNSFVAVVAVVVLAAIDVVMNVVAAAVLSWCQFHQHFTRAFFVQKSFMKLFSSYM